MNMHWESEFRTKNRPCVACSRRCGCIITGARYAFSIDTMSWQAVGLCPHSAKSESVLKERSFQLQHQSKTGIAIDFTLLSDDWMHYRGHRIIRRNLKKTIVRPLALLAAIAYCFAPAKTTQAASTWTEESFEDFQDGEFLDAGSNLYVSRAGRLQLINRWDLNGDGHLDVVLPSGHAHTEKENTYV